MLLLFSLKQCCDECYEQYCCEKIDPLTDKIRIELPLVTQEKVVQMVKDSVMPSGADSKLGGSSDAVAVAGGSDSKRADRMAEKAAQIQAEFRGEVLEERNAAHEFAESLEHAARIQQNVLEDRELQEIAEVAAAIEAQEIVEAQELLEAQEASLREQLHEEMVADDAEASLRYEEEQRLREERLKEEQEDKRQVESFLKANGFADIDAKRSRLMRTCYPLHVAVSQNNADMVQLLLAEGARSVLKNSAGLTPLQLAMKLDKKGSQAHILKLLRFDAGGN